MVPQFGGNEIEASTNWRNATTVRAVGLWLRGISHKLKALYKILPRQLPYLPIQLQFEERSKDFGGRHFVFQQFDQLINVGGFVGLEQLENLFFVGRDRLVRE